MSASEHWKAISLTHVEYLEGDFLSYILAYSSLLPLVLLVSIATLILFRRDLHTIFFLIGFLVNEVFNYCLKHIIKEPRPMFRVNQHVKYGMPSSHAQFMSFFATYMALFLYLRIHHNCSWKDNMWKHASLLLCYTVAIIVCISRVYLKYHTTNQVLGGAFVGILMAALWFCLVHFLFTPYFQFIATKSRSISSRPISEYLMIRDLYPIPNVLWFEYCTQRNESRSRLRKGNCKKN